MPIQDQIESAIGLANFFPLSAAETDTKAAKFKERGRQLYYATNDIWAPLQRFIAELTRVHDDDLTLYIDMLPLSDLEDFEKIITNISTLLNDLKSRIESADDGNQVVNIAPLLPALTASLIKFLPRVSHHVRFLCNQKDNAQGAKIASNFRSLPDATAQLDSKIKETHEAAKILEEKAAKLAQFELADGQIIEINKCIERHKAMSNWCLGALVVAILIAGRLIIWISADEDKFFFWAGPMFKSLGPNTTSGVAFYFGVSKLVIATFAFTLMFVVGRLYQTFCHNVVMNEQRLVGFMAFKKMIVAITEPGPREKLTEVAAHAIFDHGSSGFLPRGSNELTPLITPLLEIAKSSKS